MEWSGGIDFLRLISDSLRMLDGDEIELVLFAPKVSIKNRLKQNIKPLYRWLMCHRGDWSSAGLALALAEAREQSFTGKLNRVRDVLGRKIAVEVFENDSDLAAKARALRIDCLMPAFRPLSKCVTVPWIGYIFDFQHLHLPHFFSADERAARDRLFVDMARGTGYVIVNSKDTRHDCMRCIGEYRARFVALPFGASPKPEWLEERGTLRFKYELPQRYFIVSNQFWVHKNHKVVFEALAILKHSSELCDIGIVCTGSPVDPREPSYYPSLLRYIEDNGLTGRVRMLGLIPKRDQIEIMKGALAVVQPTLFEGGPGGGSVYDAISLGVPVLVSDIPINRELVRESAALQFFNPHDSTVLAQCMRMVASAPRPRTNASELLAEGQIRARRVGCVLRGTIKTAILRQSQCRSGTQ